MKPDKKLTDILLKTDKAHQQSLKHKPDDRQWAQWWAAYLLGSTKFNQLTQRHWSKTDLAEALEDLKTTYDRRQPKHHWSSFFALRLTH